MPILLEVFNLVGSIGAFLSFPLLLLPCLVFVLMNKTPKTGDGGVEIKLSRRQYNGLRIFLLLSAIFYVVDVSDRFGVIRAISDRFIPLKVVDGQEFVNTDVPLDGMDYENCYFKNVTFIYNGHRVRMTHNDIVYPYSLTTNTDEIKRYVNTIGILGFLRMPLLYNGPIERQPNTNSYNSGPAAPPIPSSATNNASSAPSSTP